MEKSIEEKLKSLYELQLIDTTIDKLRATRGELPMEVADLEDELTGLETRIGRYRNEVKDLENEIAGAKIKTKENQQLIKKYQTQLNNVKNNREFEALTKETELLELEIQALEKRMRDWTKAIEQKNLVIETAVTEFEGRKTDLKTKKSELDNIVAETEEEEKGLTKKRDKASKGIEDRLILAYDRIRKNVKNGIAIATVERDSCSGCFGNIPPQMQSDIRQHKKIIVCEHCGRILVEASLVGKEVQAA